MLLETPGLLLCGTELEYLDHFITLYRDNNSITIPEFDKKLLIYTNGEKNKQAIMHLWRGGKDKNFALQETYKRAQKIGLIRYSQLT